MARGEWNPTINAWTDNKSKTVWAPGAGWVSSQGVYWDGRGFQTVDRLPMDRQSAVVPYVQRAMQAFPGTDNRQTVSAAPGPSGPMGPMGAAAGAPSGPGPSGPIRPSVGPGLPSTPNPAMLVQGLGGKVMGDAPDGGKLIEIPDHLADQFAAMSPGARRVPQPGGGGSAIPMGPPPGSNGTASPGTPGPSAPNSFAAAAKKMGLIRG